MVSVPRAYSGLLRCEAVMTTVATANTESVTHNASDVSLRILEALCLDDEFKVLRETLRLYREELAKEPIQ